MKKFYLSLSLIALIQSLSFAQTMQKFNLTAKGVQPIVIVLDSSFNSNLIYKKAKEWVQLTYKNPSEVLKGDIENSNIRIVGYSASVLYAKGLGVKAWYDVNYTLEIEIKEGKYRLTYAINNFLVSSTKEPTFFGYESFFKNDGTVKGTYSEGLILLIDSMNELSTSLYNYIKGIKKDSDNNW